MTSRREQVRQATREEIKCIAREQMAAQGNASISLHAIARAMGMTAPALYRYFPTSDDLITALVVDAYLALAQAQETAYESQPTADPVTRLLAVVDAYRAWALQHSTEFTLIYGTPIPGYSAPAEITMPAARRGLGILLKSVQGVVQAHADTLPDLELASLPEFDRRLADAAQALEPGLDPRVLYLALVGWGMAQGLVYMELFHHVESIIGDSADLYRHTIRLWLKRLGVPLP
ncbi:MAG TPA: TetR/AcrR family transcriptional regulator [Ktedonobacteraceae bacterium]|nr:TetR/AcrR family transcriptional regulator [Ktedonobacteraceae bacterium]